jgi:hypothetical protein
MKTLIKASLLSLVLCSNVIAEPLPGDVENVAGHGAHPGQRIPSPDGIGQGMNRGASHPGMSDPDSCLVVDGEGNCIVE